MRRLAVLTGSGVGAATHYIHADHLNAPKVITDQIGNTVWNWDHDPFGNGQPTGTFTYHLRFPGQYYDMESGLSYNLNRDYDPAIGRYVESDPIGLEGGINTYGYVGQNPLWATDPEGHNLQLIFPAAVGLAIVAMNQIEYIVWAMTPPRVSNVPPPPPPQDDVNICSSTNPRGIDVNSLSTTFVYSGSRQSEPVAPLMPPRLPWINSTQFMPVSR